MRHNIGAPLRLYGDFMNDKEKVSIIKEYARCMGFFAVNKDYSSMYGLFYKAKEDTDLNEYDLSVLEAFIAGSDNAL